MGKGKPLPKNSQSTADIATAELSPPSAEKSDLGTMPKARGVKDQGNFGTGTVGDNPFYNNQDRFYD